MSGSNAWAEFAGIFARTRAAYFEHEQAKTKLKTLMPEDAKEAIGHGVRAKRSKSGAVSFDLLVQEGRSLQTGQSAPSARRPPPKRPCGDLANRGAFLSLPQDEGNLRLHELRSLHGPSPSNGANYTCR
jgi:hypothetical protein